MDLHGIQKQRNKSVDDAVADCVEERLVTRDPESLGFAVTDGGQGSVEGNQTHRVGCEEHQGPEEDPDCVQKLTFGASDGDPAEGVGYDHGQKTHCNRRSASAPFGRKGIGDVCERDIDDSVECFSDCVENREDGRENEACSAHYRLIGVAASQCGGVDGVGVVGTHENHQEIRSQTGHREKQFLSS